MRFKRLRVILAVVLVLFVLFVANTIAFGFIREKYYANQDSKKDSGLVLAVHDNPSQASAKTESPAPSQPVVTPTPAPTPPPVTTHTTRRTRAS